MIRKNGGIRVLALALLLGAASAGSTEQYASKTDAEIKAALEQCSSEYKVLEAALFAAGDDIERLQETYKQSPTPENEQAVMLAVDAQVDALFRLAPKERECKALDAESSKRSSQ